MSKLLLCSLILLVCASSAVADSNGMPDLSSTENLALPPALVIGDFYAGGPCFGGNECYYMLGNDGFPASGWGNFNANASGTSQMTYNFITGLPLTWTDDGYSYGATFGLGGSFQMSLPNGMTFSGIITSGSAGAEGLTSFVEVNYAGRWSNGQFATGTVDEQELGFGPYQYLSEQTMQGGQNNLAGQPTPEPSTFLLFGSAVLGTLGWRKHSAR